MGRRVADWSYNEGEPAVLFSAEEYGGEQSRQETGADRSLERLFMHLLGYKWLIIGAAIIGLLITAAALSFVTPKYDAEAVLIVDSRRNKLADAESALSSIVADQAALKSEIELMRSSDLARHVIETLGLMKTRDYQNLARARSTADSFKLLRRKIDLLRAAAMSSLGMKVDSALLASVSSDRTAEVLAAQPTLLDVTSEQTMQRAVTLFEKNFTVVNDPKSLTLRMSYRSTSPQLAAAVTNAALDAYLQQDAAVKQAAIERSQGWLAERITQLRVNLQAAEHAVERFRADNNLATDPNHDPLQEEMLQLKGRLVDAETDVSRARAKVEQQRASVTAPYGISANADVLASPLIQQLRDQETALTVQLAQASATMLGNNPTILKLTSQLADLRGKLRGEINKVVASQDAELRVAEMRRVGLLSEISQLQRQINKSNAATIRLRSLELDASSAQTVLDDFTKRYNRDTGQLLEEPDSRVVSRATIPVDPSSPPYAVTMLAGTMAFVGMAVGLSFLTVRLRHGFHSMQELEGDLGIFVAGVTPLVRHMRSRRRGRLGNVPEMRDMAVTIRALAHRANATDRPKIVLVTSSVPDEGKSALALSLARSIANGGERCLLIDADIRRPSLHSALRVPAMPGLVDVAIDGVPTAAALKRIANERFDFLTAGRPTDDPLRPFRSDSLINVLRELRASYDLIIIDSSPLLAASEALVLSSYADLTLLLVRWRHTRKELARKASSLLTRCSSGTCLAVLSQVDSRRLGKHEVDRIEGRYKAVYRLN